MNRRFLQMRSHHRIEPVACSPASGWEKGQVENQVGNLRDQSFRPKPLLASLIRAELVHRQAKSISYRMRYAKFPVLKDLDGVVFAETPVDQGLVRELATGAFLDAISMRP